MDLREQEFVLLFPKFLDTYPQPFQLTQIAGNWKLPNSSKKVLDIGNIANLAPTILTILITIKTTHA